MGNRKRFHSVLIFLAPTLLAVCSSPATAYHLDPSAKLLKVGPDRVLQVPSEAAKVATNGDTIEIDAGTYENDYVTWHQNQLTIRGAGGMAHLTSTSLIPNGKAIWVVTGDNTLIENMEFSGATVVDTNGAGIRHEGGNLTLRNTFFHDNEFSILTGRQINTTLDIANSRFWYQKRATRYSHGIYVGAIQKLIITGSHFKGTDRGHQIKTRAFENHILYNRIEDIHDGNSSRLIDLPNCGTSFVMGNDLHQAATTHNVDAIGYGAEGCDDRTDREHKLYVINNTFVNEASNGALVKNHAGGEALIANNLIIGRGFYLLGEGQKLNNMKTSLSRRKMDTWHPPRRSKAIDNAQTLAPFEGRLLIPTKEFSPPVGTQQRKIYDTLDIGSRDFVKPKDKQD